MKALFPSLRFAEFGNRAPSDDRYPLSPRLAPLKAILANLDPPKPRPELPPPLRAYMAP